ncbi:Retrovirus-related Pol polyprotein from transposon 17.6, partial [Mucuna pruriens]
MKKGDEWKIAFKTILGLYEWLVMSFGLTNTSSTFTRLMNHILRSLIDKYVVVYFDDILVYSNCIDDYILHVKSLLLLFRQEYLYVSLEKCTFYTSEVMFLGYVVGSEGVKVDSAKVKVVQNWPKPKIVGEVRSFHGLASFYKRIPLLNEIVKEDICSKLEESQERSFRALKGRQTNAHIIVLPNFSKTFELECDGSNVGVRVVLLWERHTTTYFTGKLKNTQMKLSTYDKEIYALMRALQVW